MRLSRTIFREYDIRGIVGDDLSADIARAVGRAYATRLHSRGDAATPVVAVGHDNRPSSPELAAALCAGLNASGVDVRLLDTVPTPVLYFATRELGAQGGIQITGSHNPPEYNGIKMTVAGAPLYGEAIQDLRRDIEAEEWTEGSGATERVEILDRYVAAVRDAIAMPGPLKVVLDCGNGTGSVIAVRALEEAGIEVVPLYCDSDGTFPNHHPDPTVDANLVDLIAAVRREGAALGIGLDGDADRIGAVDETGRIVRGDHLLLLYALDILVSHPGAEVVFDVKCSKALPEMIERAGGVPVMWKTGHSLIKERMRAGGSPVAGEMSGHICLADRWFGVDDAIYDAARLAELVARAGRPLSELAAEIPAYPSTPELRVDCPEERKFGVVRRAVEHFGARYEVIDIDGARVLFDDGWALIRASNTQPVVVCRFEADSTEALRRIHAEVAGWLADEGVRLPDLPA
ncbi:MAG: phosphomannomutase/phosphoglucomutase [Gemmatimonadota bacterium]|nr:phosphomannomutase/phosphoglucomutase [Gemmatimonadota bacterium]